MLLEGDLFSKRVSSYVCIFCAILNNLVRVIYVISDCHMAITCITGSINVNKQDDYTGIPYLSLIKSELWSCFLSGFYH